MSKKKLVSILLSAVLCFGMLGGTFVASAESVSVHLTKTQAVNSSSNVYGTFKYYWGKTANPQNTACTISLATKTKVFGTQGAAIYLLPERRGQKRIRL